jgi:translation initiation factor IF-2
MVVTNLIEKKVVQFSSRGSVSVKADDDNDLLLKPPQKSVLPNGPQRA